MIENTPRYQIQFSKKARKDITSLTTQQKNKLKQILLEVIAINPYLGKSLKGRLKGLNSYRLNRKDRILYEIYELIAIALDLRANLTIYKSKIIATVEAISIF